jgi:hypothetical protein
MAASPEVPPAWGPRHLSDRCQLNGDIRGWIDALTWGGPDSRVDAQSCLYWTGRPALPALRAALEAMLHLNGCPPPPRSTHSRVAAVTPLLLTLRSIDISACIAAARLALRDDHPLVRRAVRNILDVAEPHIAPNPQMPIPARSPVLDGKQHPIPHEREAHGSPS